MRTLWRTKIVGIIIALLLAVSGCSNNTVPTTAPLTKVEESKQTPTPEQETSVKDTAPSTTDSETSSSPTTQPVVVTPSPEPKSQPVAAPAPAPSTPPVVTPAPAPKQTPQDVTVYITKTGKKYHRDGCRYLSKSRIPISLSDAKLGYGPCSVCNPPQ